MRGGTSSLIGLLVPDVRNDFYSTAAQAISEACATAGFQVVLGITSDSAAREREHVHGLVSARAAGVILAPTARPAKETLALLGAPAARPAHPPQSRDPRALVRHRRRRGHALAAQHLLALGHRQIAYIGGDLRLSTASERFRAFEDAIAAHGLRGDSRSTAPTAPAVRRSARPRRARSSRSAAAHAR